MAQIEQGFSTRSTATRSQLGSFAESRPGYSWTKYNEMIVRLLLRRLRPPVARLLYSIHFERWKALVWLSMYCRFVVSFRFM